MTCLDSAKKLLSIQKHKDKSGLTSDDLVMAFVRPTVRPPDIFARRITQNVIGISTYYFIPRA